MKKVLVAIFLVTVIWGASSCSSYTCPTYSKAPVAKDSAARI